MNNARIGLWLCGAYILLYGGFILLSAFFPETMRQSPWLGINAAIWYGLGLIAAAVLVSFVYGVVANPHNADSAESKGPRG